MEDINNSVPDYLKCPICYEIPQNKVFQCTNGHRFCEACSKKLPDNRCPECRVALLKAPIRCLMAEEDLDRLNLEFPCQFQSSGCERKLDWRQIVVHRSSCKFDIEKFGPMKNVCGFFGFKNCSFAFNRANTEEALAHFKTVHQMRSPKALLLDQFTIVYEHFKSVYNSEKTTVFTPLIFDQKWWGHGCIYIIVVRFNPLDKTIQFTPFSLIHGWDGSLNFPKNSAPEPVVFSLGLSRGTVDPQNLLNICEGQTLADSTYVAASVKNCFNVDNPGTFSSTLQIKLTFNEPTGNFQPPQDDQRNGLEIQTVYEFWNVLNPILLNERWPTLIRQVCSAGVPQNWDQFGWIAYQKYKDCSTRFSPTSSYFKMNVLICRSNINDKWLAGFIKIDDNMNLVTPAIFDVSNSQSYRLDENFELLYLPSDSFEWVAWTDLNEKKPIPVHHERQDLLICQHRRASGVRFMGTLKKYIKPHEEGNIFVLVSKFN